MSCSNLKRGQNDENFQRTKLCKIFCILCCTRWNHTPIVYYKKRSALEMDNELTEKVKPVSKLPFLATALREVICPYSEQYYFMRGLMSEKWHRRTRIWDIAMIKDIYNVLGYKRQTSLSFATNMSQCILYWHEPCQFESNQSDFLRKCRRWMRNATWNWTSEETHFES